MQTTLPLLGVVALVGVLAPPSALATPLTLQYSVTVTRLCDFETGSCSDVNIGGIELEVTTDDAVDQRQSQPFVSRAYFGPTTLAMDTSSLGFFANPFVPETVSSSVTSWTQDVDFPGVGNGASLQVFIQDLRFENSVSDDSDEPRRLYQVLTMLSHNLAHPADGVPVDPTSADIRASLANDLLFFHQVWAATCIDNDSCVYDPRSFEASGTATFRQQIAPIPEPATFTLVGAGLVVGAAARRLRRSRV